MKRENDKAIDKTIRDFLTKVNSALSMALLNPLYRYNKPITSALFDESVRAYAKEYLRALLVSTKK